jgi:hypothetical protein
MKTLNLGTVACQVSIQAFFDQYADEEFQVIDSDGVVLAHVYPVDRKQAELFEFHKETILSDPEHLRSMQEKAKTQQPGKTTAEIMQHLKSLTAEPCVSR